MKTDIHMEKHSTASLIGLMRDATWTLRAIASVVIICFGGLVTTPAIAAVSQEVKKIQWDKPDASNAAKLSAKIEETHQALTKLVSRDAKSLDISASHAQIHALKADLEALDKGAMDEFAANEAHIKAHNLPAVIEQRQQAAVKTYRTRMDALMTELRAADAAKDVSTFQAHVSKAKDQLDQSQVRPFHEKFDPKNLPFSVAKATGAKPRLTKKDYQAHPVVPLKRVQVAANGSLAGIVTAATLAATVPASPSDPSYVAPTDDVQITPAIQAEATALHNDPVQIYNWVHNNIEYIPTYGSIQGSDMTLQTLKGNDFDQASLLIALLRAANIPSRYVYGTIQVPIAQVENLVGGVTDPNAALNLLSKGGVPVSGVVQGGQIKYAQIEHVWVEGWINFIPSHGAQPGPGNAWVPMDPSFKLYTYTQGMNLQQAVPFNVQTFIQQATAGSTSNDAAGSVQGLNAGAIQNALSSYQSQLTSYINSQNANATNADVLGGRSIVAHNYPMLATTLPYPIITIGNRFTQFPSNLQYQIQLNFYGDSTSLAGDSPAFTVTKTLPDVAEHKVSFTYTAATAADQATIDSVNNGLATSLPAYLVNLMPTLSIEGSRVGTGSPVQMGAQQTLSVTIISPADQETQDYTLTAGDFDVLAVNPAGISQSTFQARSTAYDLTQFTDPDYVGESYYQIGLGWWAEKAAYNQLYAQGGHIVTEQLPSYAMVGTSLTVSYLFGVPNAAVYNSRFIDAKQDKLAVESDTGDAVSARNFVELAGETGSSLESGIFDQMYVMDTGHSISSMEILKLATDQNIPIYTINSQNIGTALATLSGDSQAQSDISNAINAGLEAVVPGQDITVDNYSGTGYIIRDPQTGAGSYLISGGRDGGNSVAPDSTVPFPQVPTTGPVAFVLGVAANSAPAAIPEVSLSEAVAGVAGAVVAPEVLAGLAALITVLVILGIIASALNYLYPPMNFNARHYTRFYDPLNGHDIQHIEKIPGVGILKTSADDLIYFANADENLTVASTPQNQEGFACPPTPAQAASVVSAYALSLNPGETVTQRVSAWVDLTFTRKGWPMLTPVPNTQGVTEYVVAWPFLPYLKSAPIFGIQYDFTCGN